MRPTKILEGESRWTEVHETRADIYESLQQVALKYFCVPGTSCVSERSFSKAGQIVSDRRTRLKPGVVDKLMFIKKN
ncbi:uncharacterized protein LOC116656588 isoform X2 [Drosophila ananassae]|uniref:uncharacterized protein LOC116655567 isoform X2 n=1 Tax=Drosophila ananassae TaxID=7217 RepID=UPI0013A5D375|nr:uncharacterized protein LOC116655567 isoform X2 [Drosophila ananassae]XP_032312274.1 uncharacterized protein LOC116656588 isoform X2 [Drosophila ananassae]